MFPKLLIIFTLLLLLLLLLFISILVLLLILGLDMPALFKEIEFVRSIALFAPSFIILSFCILLLFFTSEIPSRFSTGFTCLVRPNKYANLLENIRILYNPFKTG